MKRPVGSVPVSADARQCRKVLNQAGEASAKETDPGEGFEPLVGKLQAQLFGEICDSLPDAISGDKRALQVALERGLAVLWKMSLESGVIQRYMFALTLMVAIMTSVMTILSIELAVKSQFRSKLIDIMFIAVYVLLLVIIVRVALRIRGLLKTALWGNGEQAISKRGPRRNGRMPVL